MKQTLTEHTHFVFSVAFSPDGQTLASGGGWRDKTVHLWDVATGTLQNTLTEHTDAIFSVAFSPDGQTLASAGGDRTIRLWDVATGTLQNTLTEHTGSVNSVAFSPDGSMLASGSGDDTLRLWDVATGTLKQTLTEHTHDNQSVAFSLEEQTLASEQTLTAHMYNVRSVAFSPDGQTLASGGGDATLWLWDVATGTLKQTFTGHPDAVESVAFSPDGQTLASGSYDGTVLLWDIALVAPQTVREDINGDRVVNIRVEEDIPAETDVNDINGDGVINIQDLTLVAAQFGQIGEDMPADVNRDGIVNIQDLVLVAGAFGKGAAAPSARAISRARLTASDVEQWLIEARAVSAVGQDRPILTSFSLQTHLLSSSESGDPELQRGSASRPGGLSYPEASRPGGLSYLRGIAVLEQLLASLMPEVTALLANYPNPFNPETWIPYQLADPAEVTVSIYSADGKLVRRLALGQRPAGVYQGKDRAAYWDGRNAQGEPVASGVYFYTLQAGEFSATRKMVIRK